jgi:hypothetical protein
MNLCLAIALATSQFTILFNWLKLF